MSWVSNSDSEFSVIYFILTCSATFQALFAWCRSVMKGGDPQLPLACIRESVCLMIISSRSDSDVVEAMVTGNVESNFLQIPYTVVCLPWTVSSVQVGIYRLGKAHKCSILSFKSFCCVACETVMLVCLVVALSCPFREDRQVLPPPSMSLPGLML